MKKGRAFNELKQREKRHEIRLQLAKEQELRCYYCGKLCKFKGHFRDPDLFTLDHLVAAAHGGSDKIWNFVGACFACNQEKRTKKGPTNLPHVDRFLHKLHGSRVRMDRDRKRWEKSEYKAGVHERLNEWKRQRGKGRQRGVL